MRKREIRQTESSSIDSGNAFSVIVMSALFNHYGALPSYFIALGESIDFSEFRIATEQYINAHKTLNVSTSELEDVCAADDITRLFRRKEATSRTKKGNQGNQRNGFKPQPEVADDTLFRELSPPRKEFSGQFQRRKGPPALRCVLDGEKSLRSPSYRIALQTK